MQNKKGFTIVEVVVLLLVIVIIGALGYMAYSNFVAKHNKTAVWTDGSASPNPTASPVIIKSGSDLDKISKELDSMSLEDSSSSQYDAASSSF